MTRYQECPRCGRERLQIDMHPYRGGWLCGTCIVDKLVAERDEVTKELEVVAARLKAAIELLENLYDEHSYYFDDADRRALNFVVGDDKYAMCDDYD